MKAKAFYPIILSLLSFCGFTQINYVGTLAGKGKLVKTTPVTNTGTPDLHSLPAGIYSIKTSYSNQIIAVRKVIKMH